MNYEIHLTGMQAIPAPHMSAILRAHEGLAYRDGVLAGEASIPQEYINQDFEFTLAHNIPAENTASRLETYNPKNASQADLLHKASFISRANGRPMGLFALGDPGVGKSHVAIGLAKTLEANGQTSRYIHVPSVGLTLPGGEIKPDETLILDDLNQPYGWGLMHFAKIITAMHHHGSGRLFITSNISPADYNKFAAALAGGSNVDNPDVRRIGDRVGAAIRVVSIVGDSYRQSQTEDPWADYSSDGPRPAIEP